MEDYNYGKREQTSEYTFRGTVIFIDVFLALRLPDYYNRNKYAFAFILLAIIVSFISLIVEILKRKKIFK